MDLSPLQRYMLQKGITDKSFGADGQVANPMGQGVADPYMDGDQAPPMTNPNDGQNEFDPRRRPRAYMGGTGMGGQ